MKRLLLLLILTATVTIAGEENVTHRVTGLFSRDREADLRAALEKLPDVKLVSVDFERAEAVFAYDAAVAFKDTKAEKLVERFDELLRNATHHTLGIAPRIATPREKLTRIEIGVVGVDCKACALAAYESIYKMEGVAAATASFRDGKVTALIDPEKTNRPALEDALTKRNVTLVKPVPAGKVLFLGNSITLHAPAPDIGWTGNWGMAATAEEKDFVHLLAADIAKTAGVPPRIMVKNIAEFERGYEGFDLAAGLKPELEFNADIVIVAIGENVPDPVDDDAKAKFAAAFARLLAALKEHGKPAIFVRSSFWPHAVKDGILQKAAADAGATFVDIGALGRDSANSAGSERKIEHAGVAGHPGDKGMRAIADAIFAAIPK